MWNMMHLTFCLLSLTRNPFGHTFHRNCLHNLRRARSFVGDKSAPVQHCAAAHTWSLENLTSTHNQHCNAAVHRLKFLLLLHLTFTCCWWFKYDSCITDMQLIWTAPRWTESKAWGTNISAEIPTQGFGDLCTKGDCNCIPYPRAVAVICLEIQYSTRIYF